MTYHVWGDKDFDWNALDDACRYIEKNCRRYARLGVHTKEKFGSMRVSTTLAYWTTWPLHGVVHPGYCAYRWPSWMMRYIEFPLWRLFESLRITKLVIRYQNAILKHFWKKAAKKWPHISEEILMEYGYYFEEKS